jgi:dienelactone hydrolase
MKQILVVILAGLLPVMIDAREPQPWPMLKAATDTSLLPGTEMLDWKGDLAVRMVDKIDHWLDGEIKANREAGTDLGGTREELARKLGLTLDARPADNAFVYSARRKGPVGHGRGYTIRQVRWRAFGELDAVGLLLEPNEGQPRADIIALADAGQPPEEICGLAPFGNEGRTTPFAGRMAMNGCRVLVPVLIERSGERHGMSTREWLHRPAWEMGRTLAGYEVQMVLAGVDCFNSAEGGRSARTAVVGWGEGGRVALYAAALDDRIDGALVSGYFGPRDRVWDEPADRTVFGLLDGHSDAGIASLIAPRSLVVEVGHYPRYGFRLDVYGVPERLARGAAKHGKPGRLLEPSLDAVRGELARIKTPMWEATLLGTEQAVNNESWRSLLAKIGIKVPDPPAGTPTWDDGVVPVPPVRTKQTIARRHDELVAALERHNQWALTDSKRLRDEFIKGLNFESPEKFTESTRPLRASFSRDVIGEFAKLQKRSSPRPRSRAFQEGEKTRSFEVVLDVHEGVFAYGILTIPKDLKLDGSERRPVVVCQHGLEGRPQSTVGEQDHHYYKAFATRLAERGFVTFAPQNIYIGHDRFRILQFKANTLGCTLFSIMVPQHRQITNWLAGLPFVDQERIAFYGLSYGGKSAMRIPPLVERYCLSICSADFNEWIWKNSATDSRSLRYSYANKGEYEIFEFNLGNTFNYYEMAALICPRPFMVERGHFDGVAPDETVAYEFAKVRHLYAAKLGIDKRTTIEWFVGPHTIHGVGTYKFLHQHLKWPVQ